jgi:hypothetical protein
LPGLKKDGILIGVNWSGDRAKGYDIESDFVRDAIEIQLKNQQDEQDGGGQPATRSESK